MNPAGLVLELPLDPCSVGFGATRGSMNHRGFAKRAAHSVASQGRKSSSAASRITERPARCSAQGHL